MAKIRVLVVDDSLTVRQHLLQVLASDMDIDVVGEASNGKRAIELCQALRPDVVSLDMMLPVMTGVAATEYIMAYCPTPILIVSASTNRGELFRTYEALAAGAVDVLEKTAGNEASGVWEKRYLSTLKLVARIKVITHPRGRLGSIARPAPIRSTVPAAPDHGPLRAVAIGVSTGGPAALLQLLGGLTADFPLPILLVIHIGAAFAASFAEWLDAQSDLRARYARDGEPLPPVGHGCVLLAPPDHHLEVRGARLALTRAPERHSCRPSVDVLFESAARELGARVAGCLLTGMGKDGAEGLVAMRRAGGATIAQDEATCVVFGMPREAILLGGAERVLPLAAIAPALVALAASAS